MESESIFSVLNRNWSWGRQYFVNSAALVKMATFSAIFLGFLHFCFFPILVVQNCSEVIFHVRDEKKRFKNMHRSNKSKVRALTFFDLVTLEDLDSIQSHQRFKRRIICTIHAISSGLLAKMRLICTAGQQRQLTNRQTFTSFVTYR